MKLEMNREEAEAILLEWAQVKFPGMFDCVELQSRYGLVEFAFSKSKPEPQAAA